MNIYLLFTIFLLIALVEIFLSFWKGFTITSKLRKQVIGGWIAFWAIIGFFLFFPFPQPDPPTYITGTPARFDGMQIGFSRALFGVLGPNVSQGYKLYQENGWDSDYPYDETFFARTYPLGRTTFGGTELLQHYRADEDEFGTIAGGVLHYPSVKNRTEAEDLNKVRKWNAGDLLFPEVARELGYEDCKARYTPEENSAMIVKIAKWLGATEAGAFKFDPRFVYSYSAPLPATNLPIGVPINSQKFEKYKYGIQVLVDQNWDRTLYDPGSSWWSVSHSGAAYSTSAWIAVRLAAMLRDMGYNAIAEHGETYYETIETPGSVYSGLGEYGRLSDVVVPSVGGLRFKSATVLTDMPLEVKERTYVGCNEFCNWCTRCARSCPVDAIAYGEKTTDNGVTMWHVDKDKCTRFRISNLEGNCCNECLKYCPYNKPPTAFHHVGNYLVKNSTLARWMFGDRGLGLEDYLDFTNTGPMGDNKPARWVIEPKGWKMKFPFVVGNYIYTEDQRSKSEEWSTGVGAKMGKIGLSYKGERYGEIPSEFVNKNVHSDLPNMKPIPTDPVTVYEAMKQGMFPPGTRICATNEEAEKYGLTPEQYITPEDADKMIKKKKDFIESEKDLYKHYGKEIGVKLN